MSLYARCSDVESLRKSIEQSFDVKRMTELSLYQSHKDNLSYAYGIAMQIKTSSRFDESTSSIKNEIMHILFNKDSLAS